MASRVDVYNQVRTLLREAKVIASILDDNKLVDLLNTHWDVCRDALLRQDYWTFARRRALLSADATAPEFGWTYRYLRLPTDMRLIGFTDQGSQKLITIPHELEGRYILTDQSAPLKVKYITSDASVSEYDPLFVQLLSIDLGMRVAGSLTGKVTHIEILSQMRQGASEMASRINSLEQEDDYAEPDQLTESRAWPV